MSDFFEYLLFKGGNSASRAELETETLPYTFYTQPKILKNYRIYGNTEDEESVGDKTANCFDKNDLTQIFGPGYNLPENQNVWNKYAGTAYVIRIPCKASTTYTLSIQNETSIFRLATIPTDSVPTTGGSPLYCARVTYTTNARKYTFTTPNNAMFILFQPSVNDLEMVVNTLMLAESSAEVDYEPYGYKIPVVINEQITNIYLDEPLAKSGDIADYIDFRGQKRFNIDGTSEDVTLPEIAVFDDENEISFNTTVQPSKVYLQGNISATEVSSRSLQASPQMLNLQLGKFTFLPNDFSENLDDLDELEKGNIVDKTPVDDLEIKAIGDDENAEC